MLNKDGIRELAYVVKVNEVRPIAGKDRVECAVVNGWTCMVPKGQFNAGTLGVYFEIDSKVDTDKPEFAFTEKYHGKIKTQKFKTEDGPFYSQGLLMSFVDFGWAEDKYEEGTFLTAELGVTYADAEDNTRKAKSADRYKLMAQRHPEIFRNKFTRFLYQYNWGKKLLFVFFGKDVKKKEWPAWVVKTDEERCQNLGALYDQYRDNFEWIATEKIDGTSTTFSLKRVGKKKFDYFVCSRNVVMNLPGKEKTCFYAETDGNVYVEMSNVYNMEKVMKAMFADIEEDGRAVDYLTIQGETYGGSIQKRNYGLERHELAVFNLIVGYKDGEVVRYNPRQMKNFLDEYGIPSVPILGEFELPETVAELLEMATDKSKIDFGMREGIVLRSKDGRHSFKAVSNEFLVKYHQ